MGNTFKSTWWILLLIAAGAIILFLSLRSNKAREDQGVVLSDIFHSSSPVTVAPKTVVAGPVNGHQTGFIIQVYSFQDKNRAQGALQALKNRGYQAFLAVTDLGQKGVWYRVRVGGIGDEAAARKMLDDIRQIYNSGFILKGAD